jgi:hypothetical protein
MWEAEVRCWHTVHRMGRGGLQGVAHFPCVHHVAEVYKRNGQTMAEISGKVLGKRKSTVTGAGKRAIVVSLEPEGACKTWVP